MRLLFVLLTSFGCVLSLQGQPSKEEKSSLASIERRMQAVYEQVGPAIVRFAYGKDPERSLGNGVIVTADGYVVTTNTAPRLVVQDDLLAFRLADGRRVRGKALGWSSEFRIGLLKITEKGPWPHVDLWEQGNLGNRADLQAGQLCVALGYPQYNGVELERRPTLRPGSVTKSAVPIWLTSSCVLTAGGYSVPALNGYKVSSRSNGLSCLSNKRFMKP